ncbi:MauE/DoxX family redox-associated membrane protein [Actinomadura kijaniata]|uniref:MauE/DoxX family redox-associated membrane protein n=1 Tax=Actinomadura kijaniata TaxID=46161 RepID=UPI003F1C343C
MQYLPAGCACLIGLVFAVSAFTKLRDRAGFVRSVPDLAPALPARLLGPLAHSVIVLEAAVPVLLAVPATRTLGFGVALVLLTAFTVAIAGALRRGRRAPCRCFGASAAPLGPRHLARNGVLLTAAATGAVTPGDATSTAGLAVAAAAGLVTGLLIVSFDDLVDLFAGSH